MGFFAFNDEGVLKISHKLWIYPAIVLPLTVTVFVVWYTWTRLRPNAIQKRAEMLGLGVEERPGLGTVTQTPYRILRERVRLFSPPREDSIQGRISTDHVADTVASPEILSQQATSGASVRFEGPNARPSLLRHKYSLQLINRDDRTAIFRRSAQLPRLEEHFEVAAGAVRSQTMP